MSLLAIVVDDDAEVRALARRSLQGAGVDVEEAADVEGLSELLERTRPDVVVLDLTMPGPSGWSALNAIRADPSREHLPIVILTSHDDDQFRAAAKKAGVNHYLTKPFKAWELVDAVERSAGQRRKTDPWA